MPANEDHNAAGWALYSAPTRDAAMLEKAIAHFEAALVENPDAGTALSNLLDALLAAGREFEAVARAGLHAGVDRGSSRANNWLGWYYLNTKKDLPRALEHLERAATWGGWWGVAHLNYAVALEISGDVDKAYAQIGRRARSRRSTSHKRDSVTQMRAACHREEPWFSYVLEQLKNVDCADLKEALLAQAIELGIKDVLALGKRVVDQTERRVLRGESVPATEKIVSTFEPHTDIIIKDRRDTFYGHKICSPAGRVDSCSTWLSRKAIPQTRRSRAKRSSVSRVCSASFRGR